MDELNPQVPAKRGRGRPRKYPLPSATAPVESSVSPVLQALLNDPTLLNVDQYEYSEPVAPAPALAEVSTAAEPHAKAELDSIVTAAAFQDGFSVVEDVAAQNIAPSIEVPEDSTRARQVRRANTVSAVTRWRAEETIIHPTVGAGHGDESIHVVDLRGRIVAESAEAVQAALQQPIEWQQVDRATVEPVAEASPVQASAPVAAAPAPAQDDFFLDTVTPPSAPRTTRKLSQAFEHVGRGAWLYWSLVGQAAVAAPNYFQEVVQKFRRQPGEARAAASLPRTVWHRAVKPSLSLAVVSVLVVGVPLAAVRWVKNVVADSQTLAASGENGLQQLQGGLEAAASLNFEGATQQLQTARETFGAVGRDLASKPAWLFEVAKVLPGSAGAAGHARDLAAAGQELAAGGELLASSLTRLQLQDHASITDQLQQLRQQLGQARGHLQSASQLLSTVPLDALPESHRSQFKSVKDLLPVAVQSMDTFGQVADFAYGFLGGGGPKTYLVLSQNPNELRGTGGFLGGMALVTIDHGAVQKLDMPGGGPYDTEAAQKVRVAGPKPLRLLRDGGWYLWDANWWPDGPASLDKIEWFWKNSDGRPVDGVVTVSAPAFSDLLAVTGPIAMPEYGKTITSENFIVETQRSVELDYDREENKPKQFLADLTPKLLQAIFSLRGPQVVSALSSLNDSLAKGYVLIRTHDSALQQQAHQWGWDGAVRQTTGDYFMLVDTNIGGGKTDGSIVVDVSHRAEVQPDGQVVVTAHVTRSHRGTPGDVFTGVTNVDYMRMYVPEGAELLSATGFDPAVEQKLKEPLPGAMRDTDVAAVEDKALRDEVSGTRITREFGKTVFANWVVLPVGESRSVEVRYRLPQRLWVPAGRPDWLSKLLGSGASPYATYQLMVQAQPGTTDRNFHHELLLPSSASVAWSQGSPSLRIEQQQGSLSAKGTVVATQTYGAILYRSDVGK